MCPGTSWLARKTPDQGISRKGRLLAGITHYNAPAQIDSECEVAQPSARTKICTPYKADGRNLLPARHSLAKGKTGAECRGDFGGNFPNRQLKICETFVVIVHRLPQQQ